jgi:hypothetical protein
VLPSALEKTSAPRTSDFGAQWLAYALPYRRFVDVLASGNARLGVDVVRYAFIVSDFHRLLLAGLPAHFESYMPSHAVGLRDVSARSSSSHGACSGDYTAPPSIFAIISEPSDQRPAPGRGHATRLVPYVCREGETEQIRAFSSTKKQLFDPSALATLRVSFKLGTE